MRDTTLSSRVGSKGVGQKGEAGGREGGWDE